MLIQGTYQIVNAIYSVALKNVTTEDHPFIYTFADMSHPYASIFFKPLYHPTFQPLHVKHLIEYQKTQMDGENYDNIHNIQIHVDGGYGIGIEYRTHVQSIGWQGWKHDGQLSGTSGQSKRLEAIQIRLTGNNADLYDVYYRVHAQTYGWMGWVKMESQQVQQDRRSVWRQSRLL